MRFSVFLCIAMVGILVGNEARAAAGRDYEVTYYAERQLQTYVGTFYKPCGTGAARLTGQRTRYFTKSQSSCLVFPPDLGPPIMCHYTQASCTDVLADGHPISHHAPGFSSSTGGASRLFPLSAADRALYEKNQRDSGIKGN
jgi:hypothetical protein